MITVLMNASIIWLSSLLVFELLLKKETFHRMNRAYLLLTFICGLILPLLPWGEKTLLSNTISQAAIDHSVVNKAMINPAAGPAYLPVSGTATMTDWVTMIYITGVAFSLLLVLKDLLRSFRLFHRASRYRQDGWIIAATGVQHGPFSLMHIIFVSSREQYTDEQWEMIMNHEQQHHHSRHILDLALLQMASIALWFHPLVHLYRYKLQLVHEYEVDSRQEAGLQTYGHFLLEQSLLQRAPAIAHSFNHSPLKNRIQMMTRNTSKSNRSLRFLLLFPMIAAFGYCCVQNTPKTEIVSENNHTHLKQIQLKISYDTVMVENVSTGERAPLNMERVDQLNGQKIATTTELRDPPNCISQKDSLSLKNIIKQLQLQSVFSQLKDATYIFQVNTLIVGIDGYIKSFRIDGPFSTAASNDRLDQQSKDQLLQKLAGFLLGNKLRFSKGLDQQGKPTPYFLPDNTLHTRFEIRNGQLIFGK